ncbi:hypothetical protein [Formosa sp. PL04]|uniref:hypothetical protein n=1 Tax=Formosa sp. PL04 TaxID=3081755 RepID=UPI002981E27D|nr:hypothetical protein [Formosa sp. PL04]MDW5288505.1 hypothetical protein [Formosa sp. PL04]
MKKLLFAILMITFSCSDKKSETKKKEIEIVENWTEFKTTDSIPELLNLTLKKVLKNDFKIANPNEQYNETDVLIYDSAPRRQLRLLSRKNNIWRISYVQGGFGKHYVFAECKLKNDSISEFKITQTNLKLESNDSIDKYLAEKKLKPNEVEIIMK